MSLGGIQHILHYLSILILILLNLPNIGLDNVSQEGIIEIHFHIDIDVAIKVMQQV